jgi:hypothetical protein
MRKQIFCTGTHVDGAGQRRTYNEADLDEIAQTYNRTKHFAPLVKGHPSNDAPSYGGVTAVIRDGRKLYGDVMMSEPVANEIKNLSWLDVSVALYDRANPHNPTPGKLHLRHLGLQGATPPVVKGMDGFTFAEGDTAAASLEYADIAGWMVARPFEMLAGWMRNLRDNMIAEKGLDEADNLLPSWKIDQIEESARELRQVPEDDAITNPIINPIFSEQTMTPEEIAAMQTKNAQLEAANATLTAASVKAQKDASHASHASHLAYCEGLITAGKLLPADKDFQVAQLDHLAQQDPATDKDWQTGAALQYAEGGVQKSRYIVYKEKLAATPQTGTHLFAEQATATRVAQTQNAGKSSLVADAEQRCKKT